MPPLSILLAVTLDPSEVARHDQASDCWLILYDQVYDVTAFVQSHPGGDALLRGCGKDATWFYEHRDDGEGAHSDAAQELLADYRLGGLGDQIEWEERPPRHPHDTRGRARRTAMLPTPHIAPGGQAQLQVQHSFSTGEVDSAFHMQVGFGIKDVVDVQLTSVEGEGVGSLELRALPLAQHGDRPMPLSVAAVVGGGYAYGRDAPTVYGQLILDRTLWERRLSLRAVGTGALVPGGGPSAASLGAVVELRPIPVHGFFGELIVPLSDPSSLAWSGGLALYTRGHHFSLYAASTPWLSTPAMAEPLPQSVAIGFALDRTFGGP